MRIYALLAILLLFINASAWNIHLMKHPIQDYLNINDFQNMAVIIKENQPDGTFNVAMHAQGDNRAMPLRYTLLLQGLEPEPYENYSDAEVLYFAARKDDPIDKQVMWEYTSFGRSIVNNQWIVNDQYMLYELVKKE